MNSAEDSTDEGLDAQRPGVWGLIDGAMPSTGVGQLVAVVAIVLAGTALLTLSAKINVPVWPVPVTLQSLAVALIAAGMGARLAVITVVAYLLEGVVGLPVFATGGGIAYLVGPTGGFLLGIVAMAFIIGRAADKGAAGKLLPLLAAMIVGDIMLFAIGISWLMIANGGATWLDHDHLLFSAFAIAVQPFVLWDLMKMCLAAVTMTGLWALLGRNGWHR